MEGVAVLSMEGVAVFFVLGGLLLGRWWWIACPLALTLPIVTWFALYDLTDRDLYGDGPIDNSAFWISAALVSIAAGLAGVGLHHLLRLVLSRSRSVRRLDRSR
jgi:hypothetical protein